jgi:ATP-dependent RNA circularization protein (DNA/RNA ligase family)
MEGQNMSLVLYKYKTFGFKRTLFGVCSRTRFIKTPDDSQFWKTTRQLDLESKVRKINRSLFIRGEHCGGKIMKNIYKFPEHKFLVFEIFDFEANRFFNYEELKSFCIKHDFDMVPVLDENFKLKDNVQDMLNYSNGKSYYGKTLREGVVIRDKEYPKISFKIRSPEYLVK